MNLPIQVPICLMMWVFTFIRLKTLHWKDIRKNNGHALYTWLSLFFFAIGFTFLIKDLGDLFDAYTFNNLSKLIVYCSFLITPFLGTLSFIMSVGGTSKKQIIPWMWLFLLVSITGMFIIYCFFISKLPPIGYYTAQSFPEVSFKVLMYLSALIILIFMNKAHIAYLPLEKSPIMYMRVVIFIVSAFSAQMYFIVMILLVAGCYFWPFIPSQALINLSSIFFTFSACIVPVSLLSNRIYARFVIASRVVEHWHAFQDMKYLVERLMLLCPVIGLPYNRPNFLKFLFDPEHYLYHTVIIILDSKTILAEFLSESREPDTHPIWETRILEEAIQINQKLQSANPSTDFDDIVETYRRISRELSVDLKKTSTGVVP